MLKNYMDRLSKDEELDEILTEESKNQWTFYIDERTSASIEQQDNFILFQYDLGPCPTKGSDLEEMLNSNLAGRGTMGSVLGLDRHAQKAILWHKLPLDADYEWFRNELEDYINNAEFWSYFVRSEEPPKSN